MEEGDGLGGKKRAALRIGTVVDNKDPKKLGRVRVKVPGEIEPASDWAFPLGTVGGGVKARGFYWPPDEGSTVGVLFNQGDPDHPWYLGGHWGLPGGVTETPGPVGGYKGDGDEDLSDLDPADAVKVKALETSRYVIFFDEREGKERLVIRDKKSDDQVEFDGVKHGITVKGTTAVRIVCDGTVDVSATTVTIQGRMVVPNGQPID